MSELESLEIFIILNSELFQFSFGDVDGKGCDAKLQHPLAVVTTRRKRRSENGEVDEEESVVVVADSYNHKLKIVTELKSKNPNCSTIDLKGVSAKLDEPGGLVKIFFFYTFSESSSLLLLRL